VNSVFARNGEGLKWKLRIAFDPALSTPQGQLGQPNRILTLLSQTGFVSPKRVMDKAILLGLLQVGYYQASVPPVDGPMAL
jgi:hypothetical protein